MLRARDVEPIQTALDKLKNRHNQQISLFHKLETLRDRLIAEGDEAIPTVLELYPDADRQQLRSLVRNAQKSRLRISRQNHSVRFSRIYVNWLKKNSNRAGPGHSRSRLNTVGGRNLFTK